MDPEKLAAMPIPVYPATAKLHQLENPEGHLPPCSKPWTWTHCRIRCRTPCRREKFLPVAEAYRLIHGPETPADWQRARDRFRYQEALVLQSALARRRAQLAAEEATARRPVTGRPAGRHSTASFPSRSPPGRPPSGRPSRPSWRRTAP